MFAELSKTKGTPLPLSSRACCTQYKHYSDRKNCVKLTGRIRRALKRVQFLPFGIWRPIYEMIGHIKIGAVCCLPNQSRSTGPMLRLTKLTAL